MTKFHADDYVQFLKMITPQNMHDNIKQLQRCPSPPSTALSAVFSLSAAALPRFFAPSSRVWMTETQSRQRGESAGAKR